MEVITYFLALNKDILTAADLGRLVCRHNTGYKGPRVIFTGTSHAKYEMTYLDESYRPGSVIFVGPLQKDVFSELLRRYPRLNGEDIKEQVLKITNCVPRELIRLAGFIEDEPDPITTNTLEEFMASRTNELKGIVNEYYDKLNSYKQKNFYKVLLKTFLGNTSTADFEWNFIDLGLVYRLKDGAHGTIRNHILCPPAQKGLLELFKELPPHQDILNLIRLGKQSGDEFEEAILLQLISSIKPVILDATDLNNCNKTTISIDFEHCETIIHPNASLGTGHERVLSRGWPNYPRFDFILGSMFIQVSISDFRVHESKDTKKISKAFDDRDRLGKNQIERYMDE
ncbi:hypothetical protein BGX20_006618, partial [Mortierella sp. AD010]